MMQHLQEALERDLSASELAAFRTYADELATWNDRINLTAITDPAEVQIRHFADSLTCLRAMGDLPPGTRLIDVGTGAGFPGLPLKIVQPGLMLTLADSVNKKADFLRHMVDALDLEDVTVLHARAESLGQDAGHREVYEWAVARAVAHMSVLAEYLLPLCKVGGRMLAMKGESAAREAEEAAGAFETLGGALNAIVPVEMGQGLDHHLVVVEKVAPTPAKYPRRPGMPNKRPLE